MSKPTHFVRNYPSDTKTVCGIYLTSDEADPYTVVREEVECKGCLTLLRAFASDVVNHPPHYTSHPSGVECITVVEHMGFNVGNAIKYLWRADLKGNALEDLKKAAWYVQREIERREKQPSLIIIINPQR